MDSGHFNPSQTYYGYKAVEVLDPACTECLAKGKDCFQHYNPQSSKCHYCIIGKKPCQRTGLQASNVRKDGPFGKEFQVSKATTPYGISGFSHLTGARHRDVVRWTNVGEPIPVGSRPIYFSSEVPIFRINTEGVVKRISRIADSPPDPDSEDREELDGEEPLANRFQSHIILSTPKTFQPTLATVPTSLPTNSISSSYSSPTLTQPVRPSPIQQPRNSPIITPQQLQPIVTGTQQSGNSLGILQKNKDNKNKELNFSKKNASKKMSCNKRNEKPNGQRANKVLNPCFHLIRSVFT
ncbi:hypothetical protein O181_082033 [Austropuccinia psidii MF-1]|uniref:Uncharacterized protein n=1 Tax=Austropuccinia psidii MF-1 TaxID=1389203 RepID=A0A9Q3II32_9BASI|nr:hypothetical protein [Austropuccinia psidii MF-1]